MKTVMKLIKDLKYHDVNISDLRVKCNHCGMYQRKDWVLKLYKLQAPNSNKLYGGYCEYCTHPFVPNLFFYEYKPIKINCKWCNPKGLPIRFDKPVKDFIILG